MLFGPWVQRAGGGKMQVFLQATLDDASRLIPHARFYPDPGLDCFLHCLPQSITARGLLTRLYMDIAKIYRSPQLARIEELEAFLAQQLKAAGVTQPLFDDTARQGLYQATKGIPRKVNKLAMTALRLAAARNAPLVDEALLLDATAEALL